MKPGMHVDNLHVERTSRFEQEKNGKDNIMIETMQWVRPEEIEARSMAIIEAEMPEGTWTPGELAVVKRCIHIPGAVRTCVSQLSCRPTRRLNS